MGCCSAKQAYQGNTNVIERFEPIGQPIFKREQSRDMNGFEPVGQPILSKEQSRDMNLQDMEMFVAEMEEYRQDRELIERRLTQHKRNKEQQNKIVIEQIED